MTILPDSVRHFCLDRELFPPTPHPETKSAVLEMRVYFGLILSPSAGSILKSLSFRKGSWRVRCGSGERAGKGEASRQGS